MHVRELVRCMWVSKWNSGFSEMVRDHGNPYIAVILFQDGYRFIYRFIRLHNIACSVKMATVTSR